MSLRALSFVLLLPFAYAAQAKVDVTLVQHPKQGSVLAVKITEDIAVGDYDVLRKGLLAYPGKHDRRLLLLDTIGGSASEAMRMGRLLREFGFDALVPRAAVCQGSCIYLLAAGKQRTVNGPVGLHRPYFPGGDSARDLVASGEPPASYLSRMGVAPSLAQDMQSTPPQRMRALSRDDLVRYRLN